MTWIITVTDKVHTNFCIELEKKLSRIPGATGPASPRRSASAAHLMLCREVRDCGLRRGPVNRKAARGWPAVRGTVIYRRGAAGQLLLSAFQTFRPLATNALWVGGRENHRGGMDPCFQKHLKLSPKTWLKSPLFICHLMDLHTSLMIFL